MLPPRVIGIALLALVAFGCSDQLEVGSDLLWSADHEDANLDEWTRRQSGGTRLPEDSTISPSTSAARRGRYALELVNPAAWDEQDEGPELFHSAGLLDEAYYSAWFLLPEEYRVQPTLTLLRLRSRDPGSHKLFNGEELQLRSLSDGSYVLLVFSNNSGFLLEPVAESARRVEAGRWFQLEARYESRSGGRLRVWLDGQLTYDLSGRPGAAGADIVLSVCNVTERSTPAPLRLFVDDAAISSSRVSPDGYW